MSLNKIEIEELVQKQKVYFDSGQTRSLSFRLQQLQALRHAILKHEKQLSEALYADLGKSEAESYTTEIGIVLSSITHAIKQLKKWMKPKRVSTPLMMVGTSGKIVAEPYGVALIIAPFNYPVQLVFEPLLGAISGGNCIVVKPSEFTPHVSLVLEKLVAETFDSAFIAVVQGEQQETTWLLESKFDFIFFTGSTKVGSIVMQAAAKQLIPVALELGGKSPTIIHKTANIDVAAKRIMWGKYINNGQTCVAPDYILVDETVKDNFLQACQSALTSFYGVDIKQSEDYSRIVSDRHFNRLVSMIEHDREQIILGGSYDSRTRYIEPTFIEGGSVREPVPVEAMNDEVFGPILTVISYKDEKDVIPFVKKYNKPLALYIFSEDDSFNNAILENISFGGGCINDTLSHVIHRELPFGGVGPSGLGSYHGQHSFDLFSHKKSVLSRTSKVETGLLFPPYKKKLSLFKKILK